MMKKLSLAAFAVSVMSVTAVSAGDKLDASTTPPGGLKVTNVPVFVVIGSDDNGIDSGVLWMVDFLKNKKNPEGATKIAGTFDGNPVLMNFYVNGMYSEDAAESWKTALVAGHEIGNHTYSHLMDTSGNNFDGRTWSKEQWAAEINKSDSIASALIKNEISSMTGFRTPRLEFDSLTYDAIQERGFLYDCSIEEGYEEDAAYGRNYPWPFTLDNGSASDKLQAEWSADDTSFHYATCGSTPGLWEIPVYGYIVPPDSLAAQYGFKAGLLDTIRAKAMPWIEASEKQTIITGFDYNLISSFENSACQMDSISFLATLKYSLDQRLAGNRAPFTLGMHTDYYFPTPDVLADDAKEYVNITPTQRRAVIEEFVNYALTKPEVRFVTGAQLVSWMKAPIGLDGTVGTVGLINTKKTISKNFNCVATAKSVSLTAPIAGTYTLSIFSVNGSKIVSSNKTVGSAGTTSITFGSDLAKGMYVAKISGNEASSVVKFSVK